MTAAEGEALAGLLDGSRDVPLEERGATAVFEAIAGGRITAEILTAAGHRQAAEDAELLRPVPGEQAARRWGLLRTAAGVPVAEVAVVLLPGRFPPGDAGITRSGALPDGCGACSWAPPWAGPAPGGSSASPSRPAGPTLRGRSWRCGPGAAGWATARRGERGRLRGVPHCPPSSLALPAPAARGLARPRPS